MRADERQNGATQGGAAGTRTIRPNVDILRTADELLIHADLPGVPEDAVEVDFDRGVLTLRGRAPARAEQRRTLREEFAAGTFERSFRLAEEFDGAQASAELHGGVLTLRVPLAQAARARKIEVRAGRAS